MQGLESLPMITDTKETMNMTALVILLLFSLLIAFVAICLIYDGKEK